MSVDVISNATVEARYEESSIFIFTVDITVGMGVSVEFSEGLELGDFASIEVGNSNLSLEGSFRIRNEFGVILNSTETGTNETGFSFANGQFLIEASISVEGNAEIKATVFSFPIDSTLSAELSGDLRLSANRAGNFLSVGEMLSEIGQVLGSSSNSGFVVQAFAIFDGVFEAEVVIVDNAIRARGEFVNPFQLNLLNPVGDPSIRFTVEVPDSGMFTIDVTDFLAINFGFNFGDGDRQLYLGAHFAFDTDDG